MSKKNYKLYRAKVECPRCHKNYSANPNCECPHCHTKFYDLSFVDLNDLNKENNLPVYFRYRCNGYTGFKDNPTEEYDMFITLATMGVNLESNLDCFYEISSQRELYYRDRNLKMATFNVKAEMDALAIYDENGTPVLFVAEAEPKKKK